MPFPPLSLSRAAQLFKMLADESRLRLLLTLADTDGLSVNALCESVGQPQPSTSHHLTLLRMSGVVTYRREGKTKFYSLASDVVRELLRTVKY